MPRSSGVILGKTASHVICLRSSVEGTWRWREVFPCGEEFVGVASLRVCLPKVVEVMEHCLLEGTFETLFV